MIPSRRDVVEAMADTLEHRGPDDDGYYWISSTKWAVNLGMRRLAIIDRAKGKQPMHTKRACVIFNGEIYNHRRLRHNMTVTGFPCDTECDTEVIGRLWDNHGLDCLSMLEGMFAFALWDRYDKSLYLVRDRVGKKPLYYYHGENFLAFGSEIKALLAHPRVPKELNHQGIYHYLSLQYVPEPMTAYKGIKCVQPGGFIRFKPASENGAIEEGKWWNLEPWEQFKPISGVGGAIVGASQQALTEATKNVVSEAVKDRLESEVPLGVYLSGGVDSAIVAAVAKEHVKELHTFCMGFEELDYSELTEAKYTSDFLGTYHHEHVARFPQLPEMIRRIVDSYDQPYGDCSAIPTMLLAEASKRYITVALTGDGGDEAFGGYNRYWVAEPNISQYLNWMAVIPFGFRDRMLAPAFRDKIRTGINTPAWLLQIVAQFKGEGIHNQMAWVDINSYLPNDIIVKMERASMATSVEARCPFLDHRVMELACSIPDSLKIQSGVGKIILKDAFRNCLPFPVLARPKKGFGVPMNEWLRSPIGRQMLMEMQTDLCWPWDILEPAGVATLVETHLNGKASAGHPIWMILVLHHWMKKHFG